MLTDEATADGHSMAVLCKRSDEMVEQLNAPLAAVNYTTVAKRTLYCVWHAARACACLQVRRFLILGDHRREKLGCCEVREAYRLKASFRLRANRAP